MPPVASAWGHDTGADSAETNVNGGAIVIGHPLGASGARIMTTEKLSSLWIGRSLFRRRRSDWIILDRPLTTGDNRLRQADGELSDLVRRNGLIQLRRIDRRGSCARR
jgi:hypothetical protein